MEVGLLVFMILVNDVAALFFFMMEVPECPIQALRGTEKYYRRLDKFFTKKMWRKIVLSIIYQ